MADSPGGREVGRVSTRVVPDTSAFGRSLERYLQRVESRTRVVIPTELDTTSADVDLRRLQERISRATGRVDVSVNVAGIARAETALQGLARTRSATLDVKVDTAALRNLTRTAGQLGGILGGGATSLTKAIASASSALSLLAAGGAGVVALGAGFIGATQAALGLSAALGQAAGSIALIPAAAAGSLAVVGTLTLGMQGLGEALKTAGDPKQAAAFQKALQGLAPAARDTVKAIVSLRAGFTSLRKAVQQSLFTGLAAEVRTLGAALLPRLRVGLSGIADQLNRGVRQAAGVARLRQSLADLSSTVEATREALRALNDVGFAQNLFVGLRDLTAEGAKLLPGLAAQLGLATQRLAAFIATSRQSGALQAFLGRSLQAAKDLAVTVGNVGRALAGVFRAANVNGSRVASTLRAVSTQLADIVNSSAGQDFLAGAFANARTVLADLGRIAGVVFTALTQGADGAFSAVAQLIRALADAITSPAVVRGLTQLVAGVQAGVGNLTAGLARPLADALARVAPLVGLLAEQIGVVANAMLKALLPAVAPLTAALGPVITILGGALVAAIEALGPLLPPLIEQIGPGLTAALDALAPSIGPAAELLGTVLLAAVTALSGALQEIGPVIGPILQSVTTFAADSAPLLLRLAEAATAASASLNAAFTGPGGISSLGASLTETFGPAVQSVITATEDLGVVALPILRDLSRVVTENWPQIQETAESVWEAVAAVTNATLSNISAMLRGTTTVLTFVWDRWGTDIVDITSGALQQILGLVQVFSAFIQGGFGAFAALLRGDFSDAWTAWRDAGSRALSGLASIGEGAVQAFTGTISAIGPALQAAAEIPARIIAGLNETMFRAGATLVAQLALGIGSQVRVVTDAAERIANKIKEYYPGSPVRTGPLRAWNNGGAGKRLVGMLATGLGDTRAVDRAAAALAGSVAGSVGPLSAGGGFSGSLNLLDVDGALIGQMRAQSSGVARAAQSQSRLSRMASWGGDTAWQG